MRRKDTVRLLIDRLLIGGLANSNQLNGSLTNEKGRYCSFVDRPFIDRRFGEWHFKEWRFYGIK